MSNRMYTRDIVSFIRQYARTYLDVMNDCMDLYSEFILLDKKKWRQLSIYEKQTYNTLFKKILGTILEKLYKYSG